MISGKSCPSGESRAKAHTNGCDFQKVLHENDRKIKKNMIRNVIYNKIICRPPKSRETIPLNNLLTVKHVIKITINDDSNVSIIVAQIEINYHFLRNYFSEYSIGGAEARSK
jgi:hypothetical protein